MTPKAIALVALVVGLAAVIVLGVMAGRAAPEPRAFAGTAPVPMLAPVADWCTTEYEPVAGGCLAVPASTPAAPLLLYLHGRYARDQSADESDRQRRVARRFTSRGYAVLALRGRLGGCGTALLADWYCWPSNEHTADSAAELVAGWNDAIGETEKRTHVGRRFVLGFSNGGYFAGLLASRGLVSADAFVIAHGGPVEPIEAASGAPALLLLSADDDVAQDDMLRLDADLTKAHWAHDSYARSGAHGLTDQDIDAALAFFERAAERLPLDPPLRGLHRPSHHAHDAGLPPPIPSGEDVPEPSVPSDELNASDEVEGEP